MTILYQASANGMNIAIHGYNTLGIIDHQRTTLLVCEVLEQLMSFLTDLTQALRRILREGSRAFQKETEALSGSNNCHHPQLRERKMRRDLPDLLLDLPSDPADTTDMTLCSSGPDMLSNPRMARQNSTNKRRRDVHNSSGKINGNTITWNKQSTRRQTHGCDDINNVHTYPACGNIDNTDGDLANGNNCSNNVCNMNTVECHLGGYFYHNGNGNGQFFESRALNTFDQEETFDDNDSHRHTTPNTTRSRQVHNNYNQINNYVRGRQYGEEAAAVFHQRSDSDAESNISPAIECRHEFYQQGQGNDDNPYDNNQPTRCHSPLVEEDPHHEFTTELVRALRNIGDNLDTKLRVQNQSLSHAVLGTTKINAGKFLLSTLRHHKIAGVALGASLELCLLFKRL